MTLQRARPTTPVVALAVLALAVAVVTVADVHQHYRGPTGIGLVCGVVRAVALIVAPVRPVVAVATTVVAGVVTSVALVPASDAEPWPWPVSGVLALVLALVVAGAGWPAGRPGLRPLLAGGLVAAHAGAVVAMLARHGELDAAAFVAPLVITAAAAFVADLIAGRRRVAAELREQRACAETELAARLQGEERARIARELHDVVAHHLSVVVVRADSAPRRVAGLDDAAVAEFQAIGDDARQSLEEMRRVLKLLRGPDDGLHPVAPQPVLTDAAGLIDEARAAGARVDLDGTLPDVRGIAGLVAYRTLQEAITNALRHAPGTPVRVAVVADDRTVRLTVENPVSVVPAAPGHGLRGMRERVTGAGGTVTAGATDDATFTVRVELPIGSSS